ncbi:ACP S-malonyltransferase [Kovacikia minuta CCNUW1]|uniref:ACP S-malonyltransferase n=1 Tax=Kovacikia minuta TaxID=2931930 RepID=UPI001CCE0270|nr:ACP S-malonyltransferase [Kovacikia minuta]UBF26938.1 ACP S-malonyltransferase [Kovacikia minuta CCNUW1]
MIFLVDHNLEGHALLLSGSLTNQGWMDLFPIRFVLLEEIGLSVTSSDRVVWRFAQANQMILLTANRKMKGKDSLEQVLREENTPTSLPIVTIGDPDRVLTDADYRDLCVNRLLELALYLDNYLGTRRVFIP